MIIVRKAMNALPEKQKGVMQTLLSMIETLEKESGYLGYGFFCDIEDKNVFNLISEWEPRQNLDHYIRSDLFSVLLGTKSLLCEPLKFQIFTVSDSEGRKPSMPPEVKEPNSSSKSIDTVYSNSIT